MIGTHALVQEKVRFRRLGLVVIDEQHKFGVLQRMEFKRKGENPDILVMTATPIPRTLALTLYGDLDLSLLDELPPGRKPVRTRILNEKERDRAYALIRTEIEAGRQAYIVYPLIEASEATDLKAAVTMAGRLQAEIFPDIPVGLLHGRMTSEEKEAAMRSFKEGRLKILVTTTVVEVGVDVTSASVMVIEHAERFGLAQLHQLRGRVGRGPFPSYCILIAKFPLAEDAGRRLRAMVRSSNGFVLAEEDLSIRGPGEFFGTRQSGIPELRVASLLRDGKWLEIARREAVDRLKWDPLLERNESRVLRQRLIARWEEKLEFITTG